MKLAVVGTHGVGKTTLSLALAAEANKRGRNVCHVGEVVRGSPFEINEKCTTDGSYWIVTTQIQRELEAQAHGYQDIICDRSAIDPLIYIDSLFELRKASGFNESHFHVWWNLAERWLLTYDMIILMPNGRGKIKSDGVRATDKKFQDDVYKLFKEFLGIFKKNNSINTIFRYPYDFKISEEEDDYIFDYPFLESEDDEYVRILDIFYSLGCK